MAVDGAPIDLGAAGDGRASLQTALQIQPGLAQLTTELEASDDATQPR